ncbi:hypothetical protein HDG32_007280 [Paraburkholderia sp. CI2]|nr:hypothetical protein [Paraburkholderia sp. CI2]
MSAGTALDRLAMNGFWIDSQHAAAHDRIAKVAQRLGQTINVVARSLASDVSATRAAIRLQSGTLVSWYVRELDDVLRLCMQASADTPLFKVLSLGRLGIDPAVAIHGLSAKLTLPAVLFDNGEPVATWLRPPGTETAADLVRDTGPEAADLTILGKERDDKDVFAWPRIDAPAFVAALKPFSVVVGFAQQKQPDVAGQPISFPSHNDVEEIDVTIELCTSPSVRALKGWSRALRVSLIHPHSAEVKFELVSDEPADATRPLLTMLEVRYLLGGTVCGTAAKALIITASGAPALWSSKLNVDAWDSLPVEASRITLQADSEAPDLTIEISKPDRNPSSGQFMCQLYSPHTLATARGPFPISLGENAGNAKSFAKALVDEIRIMAHDPMLNMTLVGYAKHIAHCLPNQVFDALREVANSTPDAAPAVLIVSTEPYVPWELAWLENPIDVERPPFLGCQTVLGRWLRDANTGTMPVLNGNAQRPAIHPIAHMTVQNLAVMAAYYKPETGLRRLCKAEDEARIISDRHGGISLPAISESMKDLLGRRLRSRGQLIGGVEAVHFAGHGDFDPTQPEASALFLADGVPLRSTAFRAADYGGALQPIIFLNACMLGIGGELLGDMAGFPGNSLRGGFGGVIGALWEIDDALAHDIALEFWRRALPDPPARGEPIGAILRDLRAKYFPDAIPAPDPTYLAYVFYGHPRLTLSRR